METLAHVQYTQRKQVAHIPLLIGCVLAGCVLLLLVMSSTVDNSTTRGRTKNETPTANSAEFARRARQVLEKGITNATLEDTWQILESVPAPQLTDEDIQELTLLIGVRRQSNAPKTGSMIRSGPNVIQIALRDRQFVESVIGTPISAERVKYSRPTITLATYKWGEAYYQEDRLTGVERRFAGAAIPASIREALERVGLRMTSLPEAHELFFSWSTGPSSFRPDSIINPLTRSGLGFDPAWVSVRRDRTFLWVDFVYLEQRHKWSRAVRDAWERLQE